MSRLLFLAVLALAACGETTYEFDRSGAGSDDTHAPRAKSNSQFLRAVYADLVGRAPTSYDFEVVSAAGDPLLRFPVNEQSLLLGTLDAVGDPPPLRSIIVAGLVRCAEVHVPAKQGVDDPAAWISEQFKRFLGREPNAYELDTFVHAWNEDPAVGPRTVIRALIGSREYQSF